eukprot:scaffold3060_cov121-Isochrysis_galbana.AAC.10
MIKRLRVGAQRVVPERDDQHVAPLRYPAQRAPQQLRVGGPCGPSGDGHCPARRVTFGDEGVVVGGVKGREDAREGSGWRGSAARRRASRGRLLFFGVVFWSGSGRVVFFFGSGRVGWDRHVGGAGLPRTRKHCPRRRRAAGPIWLHRG